MRMLRVLLLGCSIAVASPAFGEPCPVQIFDDVAAADPFCSTIDWLRNRQITVGCGTGTSFCPDVAVTRKQTAAFLNRLANALDPVVVRIEQTPGAVSLASGQVICQSPPQAIANFPRKFHVSGVFAARGAPAGDVIVTPVMSINGGPFGNLNQSNATLPLSATEWRSTAILSVPQPGPAWDLNVGSTYTFGLLVQRSAGAPDITDARCYVVVELRNRQGGTIPYDVQ